MILLPLASAAEVTYKLAAPLPGGPVEIDEGGDFISYMKYLFPFLLSVAAIAALVMFVVGGIQYMASAGNASTVEAAKEKMTQAVVGLILALGAVLILRTINPRLVQMEINIKEVGRY